MKKIMNQPQAIVDEMLKGMVFAYPAIVTRIEDSSVLVRSQKKEQKVALVSGGGSGHEPAHAGFVGEGMLDAAISGPVFTSPTPDQILTAIQSVDTGSGVFLIIKNYSGDVMNFEMARDLAEMEDIAVEYAIVADDIAVEDSLYTAGKRGVAGTVLVHKILGYKAESGATLAEIKALSEVLLPEIQTIGVALHAATVPEVGKPGFELGDNEIEYGVGIHSEPGYRREEMKPSRELAAELVHKLKESFAWQAGEKFGLLINGMGATPLMEQFVFTNDVAQLLAKEKVEVAFTKVGNYMTSIDMAGISLTMIRLKDEEWLAALTSPTKTIAW